MWRRHPNLLLRLLRPPPPQAPPPLHFHRHLSSTTTPTPDSSSLAASIAASLTHLSSSPTTDPVSHFTLHFSDITPTTSLLSASLSLSPSSGRAAADLFRFLVRRRSFHPSDSSLSLLVHHLARRHDFKSVSSLLSEFPDSVGPTTLSALFSRLSRSGRASDAVRFFESQPPTQSALKSLVAALTGSKYPSQAEKIVKKYAAEFFPDNEICVLLVKGYADSGKLDDAVRLLIEMRNGGFELPVAAYNAVLDCVCRVVRKKDPLRMEFEANKLLVEMERLGIPRDAETFRVLVTNLCKIRKTEDAMRLFRRMGEWGCSPDADTYLVLVKSLYQAARVAEGDEMIGFMRSAGFGDRLDRKAYYGFVKILCGIERVEHAMKVFRVMKGYGHAPGVKTYSLLIEKLARHSLGDRANALFQEAVARGVPVTPQVYKIDKRYVKVKKEEKKVKKRLTLPEKMIRKSKRLYKLKMSFVRKPKRRMMR